MKDTNKSKKRMGTVVNGLIEFCIEKYNVEGIENLEDIESTIQTAIEICNMYELHELSKIKNLIKWLESDIKIEYNKPDFCIEYRL